MTATPGTTGLILNEPLLWEKGKKGRQAFSIPVRDVESVPLEKEYEGDPPDFPDLTEVDVVRHYTRLSTWNFGVDTGMYPLGSCTMKYNPKSNEKVASLQGFTSAHPFLPTRLSQGALRLMSELERYLGELEKPYVSIHALKLSPGSLDPPSRHYLTAIREIAEENQRFADIAASIPSALQPNELTQRVASVIKPVRVSFDGTLGELRPNEDCFRVEAEIEFDHPLRPAFPQATAP